MWNKWKNNLAARLWRQGKQLKIEQTLEIAFDFGEGKAFSLFLF